ncbi:unnamed protein product [Pleuronectes platessa]|uniref:Uncharacterized protein n=1 Tax=Pleuronectes platessa TaxID=8262 RepID=A0A9N7UN07_PLEPL|nr:unnamed protein product [Pleuronectes platessa]
MRVDIPKDNPNMTCQAVPLQAQSMVSNHLDHDPPSRPDATPVLSHRPPPTTRTHHKPPPRSWPPVMETDGEKLRVCDWGEAHFVRFPFRDPTLGFPVAIRRSAATVGDQHWFQLRRNAQTPGLEIIFGPQLRLAYACFHRPRHLFKCNSNQLCGFTVGSESLPV